MRLSSPHAVYGLNFVHYELVEFFLVGNFDHNKYIRASSACIRHFNSRKNGHRTSNVSRLARFGSYNHIGSHGAHLYYSVVGFVRSDRSMRMVCACFCRRVREPLCFGLPSKSITSDCV